MSEEIILTFEQTVEAPASAVYYAFTNSMALQEWLCTHSQVEARVGGRVYLHWQQGYYTAGEFTTLEKDKQVAYTWQGRKEAGQSQVDITLMAENGRTHIYLAHAGLGA